MIVAVLRFSSDDYSENDDGVHRLVLKCYWTARAALTTATYKAVGSYAQVAACAKLKYITVS